jgi:hypothetical protein
MSIVNVCQSMVAALNECKHVLLIQKYVDCQNSLKYVRCVHVGMYIVHVCMSVCGHVSLYVYMYERVYM